MRNKAAEELILQRIKILLQRLGDEGPITATTSLVISGRLQSLDIVEFAVWLEQTFKIDFSKKGFNQYDFDCVENILRMLE